MENIATNNTAPTSEMLGQPEAAAQASAQGAEKVEPTTSTQGRKINLPGATAQEKLEHLQKVFGKSGTILLDTACDNKVTAFANAATLGLAVGVVVGLVGLASVGFDQLFKTAE